MLNSAKLGNETVRQAAEFFTGEIRHIVDRPLRLMEVCGTHTVAIFKAGIRQLLPPQLELVSGPGCPVCVTPNEYLDAAIAYSRQPNVIIATFGDMLKVPGSTSTLMAEKGRGADIRIVYSPLESLSVAGENPDKQVVFLAVGFETTAPTAAAAVLAAQQAGINNLFVLSAHKLVPPVLKTLLTSGAQVDGFLLPGHVCAITGMGPYRFLADEFNIPAVIAGFDPLDILQSVYMLVKQLKSGTAVLENQYRRVVTYEGNTVACDMLSQVYEEADTSWRGLGTVSRSGLALRKQYQRFDALTNLPVEIEETREPAGCCCGQVLRGLLKPVDCPLFGKVCTSNNPVGACMVSVEGACAAWFKYGAGRWQHE